MAIVYNWEFPQAERLNNNNGFQNVIRKVEWVCTAEDTDTGEFAPVYGSTMIESPQVGQSGFIPYQALQKADVMAFITDKMNKDVQTQAKGSSRTVEQVQKQSLKALEIKQARKSDRIKAPLPF